MNQRELDVLSVLGKSGHPMSLADILEARPDLIKSTVAAVLAKLLKEGMIEVAGIGYSGRSICRTFRPTEAAKEAALKYLTESYDNICSIVPKSDLIASILKLNQDPEARRMEIEQLKIALKEWEKNNF